MFPSGGLTETGRLLERMSSAVVTPQAGEPMMASWCLEAGVLVVRTCLMLLSLTMTLKTQVSYNIYCMEHK